MRDPGLMGSKIKSRADGKNPEIYRFQINNSDQTSTHCLYTVFVWCHLKELFVHSLCMVPFERSVCTQSLYGAI